MTDLISRWNAALNGIVWGPPMLVLLIGTGVVLTVVTGAVQFRHPSLPLLIRLQREFFARKE